MKLFSRKALVAGVAAVALSFAGTSAAVADEVTPTESTTPQAPTNEDGNTPGEPGEPGGNEEPNAGDDDKDKDNGLSSKGDDDKNEGSSDAKEIIVWISVSTAVVGARGVMLCFAFKYFGFKVS